MTSSPIAIRDAPSAAVPAPTAPVAAPTQAYAATLELTPARAQVGDTVAVSGRGYPPGVQVELLWYTVQGHYELENGTEYLGQRYDESFAILATVIANEAGTISTEIQVPLDFGGSHDIRGRVAGRELSQAGLTVHPTIFLAPEEGPIGTPIELHIVGVDWQPSVSTWHVLYDNRYLGMASAVTTRGHAVARFRAVGPVGDHYVVVGNNGFISTPYLAWETCPYRDMPGPGTALTFRVTADDGPGESYVEDLSATDEPWPALTRGPGELTLSGDRGTAGQPVVLRGRRLPSRADLAVRWTTTTGDRVTGRGITQETKELARVRTDDAGTFALEFAIPDDLGGQHALEVVADGVVLAATGLVILPFLVSFGPGRVRAGEQVRIHLKGVGWTTYDNTYAVTYDNAHIGYVCGFSTNGDVRFPITATGAPGTHLIDLYPMLYKAKDPGRMPRGCFAVPQLTYTDDHPRRTVPAARLAFEIVD